MRAFALLAAALLLVGCEKPWDEKSQAFVFTDLDPQKACLSADENPICAFKTYLACEARENTQACGPINLQPDLTVRVGQFLDPDPRIDGEAWTLPIRNILDYADGSSQNSLTIIGVREVPRKRFACHGKAVTDVAVGTHEIMYAVWPIDGDDVDLESVFLKKVAGHWVITATGYWNMSPDHAPDCDPKAKELFDRSMAHLSIQVDPWPAEFRKLKPQWEVPRALP
jgi:hypothetical protein